MTFRSCVYKNCENYIDLKYRKVDDVKLFGFPKNTERRQKWMALGKVSPNIPESMYFFCSTHFDKKYMAVNNRRTVLVGEAVPFPYTEVEVNSYVEGESYVDSDVNMDYYLYEINKDSVEEKQNFLDGQDIHVESTTMTIDTRNGVAEEEISNNLDEQESDECVVFPEDELGNTSSSRTHSNKRKLDNGAYIEVEEVLSKAKVLKTTPLQKSLLKSSESINTKSSQQTSDLNQADPTLCNVINEDEFEVDQLIDAQHVTTFIYKGQEYVQMPKEHYVNEKLGIIKNVMKMKRTLKAVKEQLNDLEF